MPLASWRTPPACLSLGYGQVQVWRASLDLPGSSVEALRRTLAVDELARAKRYRFERDGRRFIVARGLLRVILGRYKGGDPSQLCFMYGPKGKPQLVGEIGSEALLFNIAHSHELALFAVTRGREIGVDVEYVREEAAGMDTAERFFSPGEVAALQKLPAAVRVEAFFNCWTRKEAFIKATGEGLSLPLDRFNVSLAPGEPAALLSTAWDPEEASRWSLCELVPGPGYVAALAVEGSDWELRCWQWDEV
jgi:4'-phosphopantetheinyl transferase